MCYEQRQSVLGDCLDDVHDLNGVGTIEVAGCTSAMMIRRFLTMAHDGDTLPLSSESASVVLFLN